MIYYTGELFSLNDYNASDLFGKGEKKAEQSEETIQELHAKIGQLTMENDFLERGLERIHGPRGKKW